MEGSPRDNDDETDLEIEEVETLQEDDFQVEIHISDMEEDIEGEIPFMSEKPVMPPENFPESFS